MTRVGKEEEEDVLVVVVEELELDKELDKELHMDANPMFWSARVSDVVSS